ncbi:glycosyltransferase family 8 protein [Ruthenibacterium lactatiformans]|uniref:glycosyltransferase family 8 protein n=1 Tax=Ruthenibacterium lactatiformans TaxID=1550024 RepID=UPI003AB8D99F
MQRDKIDLLVTFDRNYIKPFQVMLKSLAISNPQETFHIWLLHSAIPEEDLQSLIEYCSHHRMTLTPIQVSRTLFETAPVSKQYPQEMYYRLLAPVLLPDSLRKVLYLDPDILVINSVRPLWETTLGESVFAAASHSGIFEFIKDVNKARLGKNHDYFNTGVLLMDLEQARKIVNAEDIFGCVREQMELLILPDQDVFNLLYGAKTLQVDDAVWNYDARYFSAYLLKSEGKYNIDWVMRNTVFLHFCGKQKPWKSKSFNRFSALYKHYINLMEKI